MTLQQKRVLLTATFVAFTFGVALLFIEDVPSDEKASAWLQFGAAYAVAACAAPLIRLADRGLGPNPRAARFGLFVGVAVSAAAVPVIASVFTIQAQIVILGVAGGLAGAIMLLSIFWPPE